MSARAPDTPGKSRLVEGRRRLCTSAPVVQRVVPTELPDAEDGDRPGDEDGDLDAITGRTRRSGLFVTEQCPSGTAGCTFDAVPSLYHLRRVIDGVEYKAALLPAVGSSPHRWNARRRACVPVSLTTDAPSFPGPSGRAR